MQGLRPNISVLDRTLININNIGIAPKILNKNVTKNSKTSDELNHFKAFFDQDADDLLNERNDKKDFETKEYLRRNTELKNVVKTLVDSCIVYDEQMDFCSLKLNKSKYPYTDSTEKEMNDLFAQSIKMLEFDVEQNAWKVLYDFAVFGRVAYENVFRTATKEEQDEKIEKLKDQVKLNESKISSYKNDCEKLNESKDSQKYKSLRTKLNILTDDNLKKKRKISLLEKLKKLEGNFTPLNEDNVFMTVDNDINGMGEEIVKERYNVTNYESNVIPIELIGMKRLDANRISMVEAIDEEKNIVKLWKTKDHLGRVKYLPEQCITLIDWVNVSNDDETTRSSFLDGIQRNYNLTKALEESRVGWNILVGQFRLKMVVPTGSKIGAKAAESVTKLVNQYKEHLTIDSVSGEVSINGRKDYKFGKNVALPSRTGNTTQIDSIAYNGVDLSNMQVVEYFRGNFYRDTNIPKSRFDREEQQGVLSLFRGDGIPYDELHWHKECRRVTLEFSKLIKLPMFYSSLLNNPILGIDNNFRNSINVIFNTDGYFEMAKEFELQQAKLQNYSTYERLQDSNREPIFDPKFLMVEKLQIMTVEEWELNESYKSKAKIDDDSDNDSDNGGRFNRS